MKYISAIILVLAFSMGVADAQTAAVKNAEKSVFKLITYKSDGSQLAVSNGVFVGKSGEAISNLKPFIGASKAVVTDSKGNEMNVTRILGVNDLYDVARFRVEGKSQPLGLSSAKQGGKVWLLQYPKDSSKPIQAIVKSVETFMGKYSYYIFTAPKPNGGVACPFVDDGGNVIGIMQLSAKGDEMHATDAAFIGNLHTTGLSFNDATMRKIGIPAALPTDKDQALLALMMSGQGGDSLKYVSAAGDFISQYPDLVDGYVARSQMFANANDFDGASKEMEAAIKNVSKKDEAHFNYGKIIYNKEVYKSNVEYKPWSLDKALAETDKAYEINPLPLYRHQKAQIIFAEGKYQEAYDIFTELTKTPIRNPEIFYEASRCKQMMKAPTSEILALLDSAINNVDTLRITDAAPYFLARAEVYNAGDSFRQAVFDYTRYEVLVNGNVDAQFHYVREQAEVKAKLYKQALNDISLAILKSPKEPLFYAEKASLELKVNMVGDAITTAKLCVQVAPEYADGYLLLGLAQIHNNEKADGLANLEEAKQLGSSQAQPLIDKYSK